LQNWRDFWQQCCRVSCFGGKIGDLSKVRPFPGLIWRKSRSKPVLAFSPVRRVWFWNYSRFAWRAVTVREFWRVRTLFCVAGARTQTAFSRLRSAGVHALCHTPDKNMWVKMKEWWVKNLVVVISKLRRWCQIFLPLQIPSALISGRFPFVLKHILFSEPISASGPVQPNECVTILHPISTLNVVRPG